MLKGYIRELIAAFVWPVPQNALQHFRHHTCFHPDLPRIPAPGGKVNLRPKTIDRTLAGSAVRLIRN